MISVQKSSVNFSLEQEFHLVHSKVSDSAMIAWHLLYRLQETRQQVIFLLDTKIMANVLRDW